MGFMGRGHVESLRCFGWPKKLAGLPPGLDQIFSQPKLFMML
jgi:hypothetical protein